jgi:hypothetical protein
MNKKISIFTILAVLVIGGFFIYQRNNNVPAPQPVAPTNTITNPSTPEKQNVPTIGTRTKSSGCISQNALPDKDCTPGAIIAEATKEQICVSGYSQSVRNVSEKTKNEVYASYNITSHPTGAYEVDHLISLELGGSNDISNLWAEPANPKPGFHEKDKVENYLHKQVCDGKISLQDAQIEIANDWLPVYNQLLSSQ